MRAIPSALLLCAVIASSAPAQIGIGRIKETNLAGDFFLPAGAINVTETMLLNLLDDGSGFIDFHGLTRLPNGHYLLSQGRESRQVKKLFVELDANGNFISTTEQPDDFAQFGRVGHTNLGWDGDTGPDSRVWAVRGQAIRSFDWRAMSFDAISVPTNLFIGLKSLGNYSGDLIRAAAIADIDGEKIIISSPPNNFAMPVPLSARVNYHPIRSQLSVIPPFQPATANISPTLGLTDEGKMGAAFDPIHGTVWWHIDAGENNPNPNGSRTRFFEMDLDGNLTGQIIQGDRRIGGIALGCDMHVDAAGNLVLTYMVSTGTGSDNPLGLPRWQDVMVEMYASFGFGSGCGGEISFDSEPYVGNLDWQVTLRDAPSNPVGFAFLMRGTAIPSPGLIIPGINSCGLRISLGGAFSAGAFPMTNGNASFNRFLPDIPAIIDLEPAWQWLMPGPTGALPLILSNAGMVRIGTNL